MGCSEPPGRGPGGKAPGRFGLLSAWGLDVAIWNTLQLILGPKYQDDTCNIYHANTLQTYTFSI